MNNNWQSVFYARVCVACVSIVLCVRACVCACVCLLLVRYLRMAAVYLVFYDIMKV